MVPYSPNEHDNGYLPPCAGEDGEGGSLRQARALMRPLLSELLGTALLVLLGVASLLPVAGPRPLTHPALGFGCLVTALVQALGPVSGAHINPAVTLAALLHGQLPALAALGYVLAQLLGGVLGFGVLVAMLPRHALLQLDDAGAVLGVHGCTAPAPQVSALAATLNEALLTGLLALVACAVWAGHDPARPDHSVPVKFGLTVAGLVYAGVSVPRPAPAARPRGPR